VATLGNQYSLELTGPAIVSTGLDGRFNLHHDHLLSELSINLTFRPYSGFYCQAQPSQMQLEGGPALIRDLIFINIASISLSLFLL
jgi:hypothetical protein